MNGRSFGKIVQNLLTIVGLLSLIYFIFFFTFFKNINNNFSSFGGMPILDKDKVSPGYTLISPYNRLSKEADKVGQVYLVDMFGKPVHVWKTQFQPLYSVLKTDGSLLVAMEDPNLNQPVPPGGNSGIIQQLDWNSKVVWEYKNQMLHHDLVPLPNGNVLLALWEKTPEEVAVKVKGGVLGTELNGVIFSDQIVEINQKGEIVWSWHSFEHLDPEIDVISEMIPRSAWTLTNGMGQVEKDPLQGREAIVLSMRSLSTIFLIDKKDGHIIWRSPKDMFNVQHDPSVLENGNILAFDNGLLRVPNPHARFGSRVLEVNPKDNKIVWEFSGGQSLIEKVRFWAGITSGAQRLKNGNTLITNGPKGHIFEVTKDGELVWDLLSPYTTTSTSPWPVNFVFKTKRYYPDEINWPEKIKPALNESSYSLYKNLKWLYAY